MAEKLLAMGNAIGYVEYFPEKLRKIMPVPYAVIITPHDLLDYLNSQRKNFSQDHPDNNLDNTEDKNSFEEFKSVLFDYNRLGKCEEGLRIAKYKAKTFEDYQWLFNQFDNFDWCFCYQTDWFDPIRMEKKKNHIFLLARKKAKTMEELFWCWENAPWSYMGKFEIFQEIKKMELESASI